MQKKRFELDLTTQGPTYPPSELMDKDGNFVVLGRINRDDGEGSCLQEWGCAIVSVDSNLPEFGKNDPYNIVREFSVDDLGADRDMVLYTLPVPLPCNNYPMEFAPQQNISQVIAPRPSLPLHKAWIPDMRQEDGRKVIEPVTLGKWLQAKGQVEIEVTPDRHYADFNFEFSGLIPDSLYTIMSLRERDLDPNGPTRPGPLGVPNVLITDRDGNARYHARMPNPFPAFSASNRNRIVNVILLWVSTQMSYGGAIAHYGLGGDIHAQLKLKTLLTDEFETIAIDEPDFSNKQAAGGN